MEKEGKRRLVKTKYDYSASNHDELSFKKGDYIEIIEQSDDDWWKGKLRDREVYGWFPAKYVSEVKGNSIKSSTLPRQATSGQYYNVVVRDIVMREERYIEEMKDIHQYYLIPLKKEEVLSAGDFETVYGKLDTLIKSHEGFLKRLRDETARSSNEQSIGSCFLDNLRQFDAFYRFYSINYAVASVIIRRNRIKLDTFMENKRLPTHQNTTLITCINKPLRHLENYSNLLGQLLDNTGDRHPGKALLKDAIMAYSVLFNHCSKIRKSKEIEIDIITKKLHGFDGKFLANTYGKVICMCNIWIKDIKAKECFILIFDSVIVLVSAAYEFQGYCYQGMFKINTDLEVAILGDAGKSSANNDGYQYTIEMRDGRNCGTFTVDEKDFEQIVKALQKKLNYKLNIIGQLPSKAKLRESLSHNLADESLKHRIPNENLNRRKSASLNFKGKQQLEEPGMAAALGDQVPADYKEKRRTVGQYYESLVSNLHASEKTYVQDIKNVLSHCIIPLATEGTFFGMEMQLLYASLDSIKKVHETFIARLAKIMTLHENDQSIGSVLLESHKEFEENYKNYFGCHPIVAATIIQNKESLDALLEKMQLPKIETSSNVTSYISIPLHRLEAYPNKLRELLNSVEEHHPGRSKLLEAFELFSDLNNLCATIRKNKEIETDIVIGKLEGTSDDCLKNKYGSPLLTCKTQMTDPEANDRYVLVFEAAIVIVGVVEKLIGYCFQGNISISPNFKVSTRLRSSGSKAYTSIDIEDKTVSYSFDLEVNDAKIFVSLLNRLTHKFNGKGADTNINELLINSEARGQDDVAEQAANLNNSEVRWNVKMLRPSRLAKTSMDLLVKEDTSNDSKKFLGSSRKKQGKGKLLVATGSNIDDSLHNRNDNRNNEDAEVLKLIDMYTTSNRSRPNPLRI